MEINYYNLVAKILKSNFNDIKFHQRRTCTLYILEVVLACKQGTHSITRLVKEQLCQYFYCLFQPFYTKGKKISVKIKVM